MSILSICGMGNLIFNGPLVEFPIVKTHGKSHPSLLILQEMQMQRDFNARYYMDYIQ
jgi:hypothetical protein